MNLFQCRKTSDPKIKGSEIQVDQNRTVNFSSGPTKKLSFRNSNRPKFQFRSLKFLQKNLYRTKYISNSNGEIQIPKLIFQNNFNIKYSMPFKIQNMM